ncbi:MAG: T9SS type A sorting domain-containing protein, partial [Bacteroidales bacterium]
TTNLINNPDFKTTIPPLGFSSAYNYGLCFPSGYHIGTFAGCPGVPPICSNCGWHQYGVGGVGNFLIADGFETATPPPPFSTPYVWREVISPVAINTRYNFSFWYTNIEKQNSGNALPNLTVLINGTTAITTGPIPENSVWYNKSYQWCADSTHANIRIISTDYDATGNDFGIDSINFNNTTYAGPIFLVQNNSCGCDPNDKNVSPQGCGINGNISKNEQLTYRVRFQNTGTGPAHNILLRDALDPNLDINTLQIIASSHPITSAQIIPTNTLIVEFDNIELPDSASNPEGSRGFIVFSISPKAGLPDGTTIKDQSGIYFDSNAVVLTNSTINTLYDNPQPDAHFKYKHSCSDPGLAYDFTYTGNTPGNANYFWTFNDASPATSTVQNPSNIIFNSSGYKLVTLTVNRNGCSEIVTDTINVNSPLSNDGKKVTICHKGQTITISINALPAHLAHGDCVGPCNSNNKSRIAVLNEQSEDAIYDFNIVPNPSDGKFTILVTGNTDGNTSASLENENIDACIYDILGNIIYKSRIYSYSTLIDLSNYSKGIYLYKITSPKNFIFTGKIIIQ